MTEVNVHDDGVAFLHF